MAPHASSDSPVTSKEILIAILVRRCLRNREIAEVLQVSEQDLKNRLRGIFEKVGVWSRVELAMHLVEHPERWQAEEGRELTLLSRKTACGVPRVGECAAHQNGGLLFILDKNQMR